MSLYVGSTTSRGLWMLAKTSRHVGMMVRSEMRVMVCACTCCCSSRSSAVSSSLGLRFLRAARALLRAAASCARLPRCGASL